MEESWRPTIICVTGDIGWYGIGADYQTAKKWLDQLLSVCDLEYDSVVFCAGNHDVARPAAKKLARPKSAVEADEVLGPPIASHLETPFASFLSFCDSIGLPELDFGESKSHLVGSRIVKGIHFAVLNSAWFCKGDDKGELWIGYPHITLMEASDQLVLHPSEEERMTVALIHHPQEWLNEAEIHSYDSRPNVVDYLANRCHLLLSGHTHGEVRGADRIGDRALHFTGGSAYSGASHFNSFRLVQVRTDSFTDRAFEFDPRSVGKQWKSTEAQTRSVALQRNHSPANTTESTRFNTTGLRDSSRNQARRVVESKSRLLKQSGQLPELVDRPVSLRVSHQHNEFDMSGNLVRKNDADRIISLYEGARHSRRTLLLGDLGTGKSTLAAQLVTDTLDRSTEGVAILIPVKMLKLAGHFTRRELLGSITNYIKSEVWLEADKFDLQDLLRQQVEVSLVFDGLDELPRAVAARLLSEAAATVEEWPTIQIVTTARPVELVGTSFSDWSVLHTVPLDDAAKREFLKQELIAESVSPERAEEKADDLLRSLKESIALDNIANTPLAIRLVYPRLATLSDSVSLTLGNLLYDVLMDRLGGWEERDDKPSAFSHLNEVFPTAEDKAEYLAILCDRVAVGDQLHPDEAKTLLKDAGHEIPGANSGLLAEEMLSYCEWLGILSVSDTVEFPLQPLAEICAAVRLVSQWRSNLDEKVSRDRDRWRVVSFATAILRRRGLMPKLRNSLIETLKFLLDEQEYVPAACYIAVESADPEIAKAVVGRIDNLGYRPLRIFNDERKASARNIARTLVLAGDTGFDWFFEEYLNPRYPVPNMGAAIVRDIFAEWAALMRPKLTAEQTRKLESMVEPYQATGEGLFFGVLPILSVVAPDAFTPDERFLQLSFVLDDRLFADFADREFRVAWDDPDLSQIVQRVISGRCGESVAAALLWLEMNPTADPQPDLVRLAMRSVSRAATSIDAALIVKECRERISEERWIWFARWFVISGESGVSAVAAKVLFNHGERRLSVLGDAALAATHDGVYSTEAKSILDQLVRNLGDGGVRWLTDRIAKADRLNGAHSSWWLVLLSLLETIDDGPTLLAACVEGLGSFTLPRYPEVREAFSRLFKSERGAEFRDAS
ncbi:MAG: NACHT domain-containing protein, partial [Verrucomicrobiales bacterium]|nr:NACHT domain-containing protein [Verrucomicrobiales bacterium]